MIDEQKKEICKAYFYGYTVEQIAEIEEVSVEEVQDAVLWGNQTNYFDDLKGREE